MPGTNTCSHRGKTTSGLERSPRRRSGLPAGRLTELVSTCPGTGGQTIIAELLHATRLARHRIALIDAANGFVADAVPSEVLRHLVWVLDGGTLLGIHQHERGAPDERFTEFRVGLDHVAFACGSRAELEKWMDRLNELEIGHGGIVDAGYGSGLSFRDPDGIALELFAPAPG